ncbi:MAG: ShlB/FhaC/HecB family hemolysin secretion/activation protein [Candidatus Omnitrophica bacterium]|nr:ShlB/FhaC/HecB family hemolysin secretion/activation protein [Candidatus Omnitrophota bacterium]
MSSALTAIIILIFLFSNSIPVEAAQIPVGQDVGARERTAEELKKMEEIKRKLLKEKEEPEIKEEEEIIPEKPEAIRAPETRVLISKITVEGATMLSPLHLRAIVGPYEGKELTLKEFRDIAEEISDQYRRKGYVTSIAYLPPQKIQNNTLRINVAEGTVGNVNLTGNRYFKTNLLLRYLTQREGDLFNYDVLRSDIDNLNEHPDRNARVLLARGEERGQTDINIQVKDRLPIHFTLGYDNYLSRYLNRNRYYGELKLTNFLGFDDIFSTEFQFGEAGRFFLYSLRYMLPVTPKWKVGAYYIHLNQKLGKEVKTLDIKGKGDILSTYISYKAIDTDNFILHIIPGFEYKDIENKILGGVVSEDNIRIGKIGFDLDLTDRFNGRTVLTQEIDFGIENILGGLEHKDPKASRSAAGAGGRFFRTVTNVARIQSLPNSLSLMLRGAMQYTPDSLVSPEQFTIGGITTVRGYPTAEHAGDKGYTLSAELYIPPYGISKNLKVPFTKTALFDAIRFLAFFDWGYVENKKALVGETKDEMLCSVGPAVRFDIPGTASVSFDYGIGLGQEASDGTRSRYYIEVKLYF